MFEALSFGSIGNATRDLASLYGAIRERLMLAGVTPEQVLTFTPQSVKKYARSLLSEEEQYVTLNAKGKKNLVKMDKKMVIKAVTAVVDKKYWGHLRGSGENSGLDDFCDSWVLLQLAKEKINE